MKLALTQKLTPGVIFPSNQVGLSYILFHEDVELPPVSPPFYVTVSDLEVSSLFHLADIREHSYEGRVVGTGFLAKALHKGSGVFCMSYTGVFGRQVDTCTVPNIDDFVLSVKTKHFFMWSKRGYATLVVTPGLASSIRNNLEV